MKHNSVDLSNKPKSFSNYLMKNLPSLDKKTPEEIIQLLKDSKQNGVNISDNYLEKVITTAEGLKHNKKMLLKYVADIVLKGADLGVISSKELIKKLASIFGTEDELLIRNIISKKIKKIQEDVKPFEKALGNSIKLGIGTELKLKPTQDSKGFQIEIKGSFESEEDFKTIVSKIKKFWENSIEI